MPRFLSNYNMLPRATSMAVLTGFRARHVRCISSFYCSLLAKYLPKIVSLSLVLPKLDDKYLDKVKQF